MSASSTQSATTSNTDLERWVTHLEENNKQIQTILEECTHFIEQVENQIDDLGENTEERREKALALATKITVIQKKLEDLNPVGWRTVIEAVISAAAVVNALSKR